MRVQPTKQFDATRFAGGRRSIARLYTGNYVCHFEFRERAVLSTDSDCIENKNDTNRGYLPVD